MDREIKKPPYTPEELNSNIAYGMTGVNNINEDELKSVQWLCEKSMNDDIRIKELEEKLEKYEKTFSREGVSLDTFLKAELNGFYYINKEWLDIFWAGNSWIFIGNGWSDHFIQTRPHHCEDCEDAHIFDWKKDKSVSFKDYGKTWALTREELEEELERLKLEAIANAILKYQVANIRLYLGKSGNKYLALKDFFIDNKRVIKCLNVCNTEEECVKTFEERLKWYM